MRKLSSIIVAVAVTLMCTGTVWPGEDQQARAIVDKAIKAQGGEAALAKHSAATFKEKGTYHGMGKPLPYTGSYAVQFPDKFRMEIADAFTLVVNGDKGWLKAGGETKEMTKEELAAQQNDLRAGWISFLLPLKDKAFTLTTIGETKVDDRQAVGVKVTRQGYPEVKLYFDKSTNLLVKSEYKTKLPEQGYTDADAEGYFSNYKDIDGLKVACKMVMKRDGKVYVEADVTDYKAAGKLDAKVFDRP
jgi:hypothetical protein